MLMPLIGKREEMEEKRGTAWADPSTWRPNSFHLLPSMSLKFQPFQNRSPSKPADRVAAPPFRATSVCQSFSSPSNDRRGLVATLPPRRWPKANLSLKIFYRTYSYIHSTCTYTHTHAVRYPVPD